MWRPEDVDAPWLGEVLGRAGAIGKAKLVGFDVEPVGTGQMGDSVRFRLHLDAEGPGVVPSVVGKFTAADEASRSTGVAMRTAEVEVRFYQELASGLPARIPACHHGQVDPPTGRFVLILEDLAPARPGDQMAGCTTDEAARALGELAAVHAPHWGDRLLERLSWLHRRDEPSTATLEQLLPELFDGFVQRYGPALDEYVIEVGERFFPRVGSYLRIQPGPRTVQHADYRVDNLLFGADTVAIVDWQTVILGPGALDVSYFLGGSMEVETRRMCEDELLHYYHQRLVGEGVSGYSYNALLDDYRRYGYAGYLMAVAASMMVARTSRGDEMFLTMARRHADHILDLESESLLGLS